MTKLRLCSTLYCSYFLEPSIGGSQLREFHIAQNDAGQRLDRFLAKAVPALPKPLTQKFIRTKRIKRNGARCAASDQLHEGDILQLYISDEFFPGAPVSLPFLGAPAQITVVYEDENILLADKPAGLLAHSDSAETADTMIGRICHYLYKKGEFSPQDEQSFAPALCNRIDRNTCGIVIAAKNAESLRILNGKIRSREVEKQYLCLVHGALPELSGTLTHHIVKDSAANRVSALDKPAPGSREAVTAYKVLSQSAGNSLVEATLITGRTHQIRAQFAAIGHPLLGDKKYGGTSAGFRRQALCAHKISFRFESDAGMLGYLNGKTFEVAKIPFLPDQPR